MNTIYDDKNFFESYARMARSKDGLEAAGEWRQLRPLFPPLLGKSVLDLGCGYGWHCKYAAAQGAAYVLGLDLSLQMIEEACKRNSSPEITYRFSGAYRPQTAPHPNADTDGDHKRGIYPCTYRGGSAP